MIQLFSCSGSTRNHRDGIISYNGSLHQDSTKATDQREKTLESIPKNIEPVFGYRFVIVGDFDGDGKKEKLVEHFFSRVDNKETHKLYNGLSDYGQLVALTVKKEPFSFLISDNSTIDTLPISF